MERFDYIFSEFDNIYVSFSGGKDSGLVYHLLLKYMQEKGIKRKIGLFHQDFEAQYMATVEYVDQIFRNAPTFVKRYWVCLPMGVRNAMSNYEPYWYPWDDTKKDIWVRSMPEYDYVVNLDNNIFDFYKYKMLQDDIYKQFGRWYKEQCEGGKTIGLLGLRTAESLHRYSGIVNKRYDYKGQKWITKGHKDVWSASPIYDWEVEDVWIANGKFEFPYNKLYDLYYKAGLSLNQMRVASPFIEWAGDGLEMYRRIDPKMWAKIVGRVNGANFGAIYGKTKAMGYREITLPEGHTWKSYTEFLLATLPPKVRDNYLEKFKTSMKFWAETGGGLADEVIAELEECGYRIRENGVSNFTKNKKKKIVFEQEIPDNTDDVKSTIDIPSWKRMCFCILKNDYLCRFMGFGPTKEQQARIKAMKEKYKAIARGNLNV
ncbi:DUF3440 domain-containing protein [bacterium 210820-DFI.6.37]|nr:DUF3440 domain-containing protein [bacterium 210820-DFI.6.37]